MIDVTLSFNEFDLHEFLSTYEVTHQFEVADSMTALDGTEYSVIRRRPVIQFSFIPLSDEQAAAVYTVLSTVSGVVEYTDPHLGDRSALVRVASDLTAVFGLRSVDGNRYYKGGKIVLRANAVL